MILFPLLAWVGTLVAQPVKIKFVQQSEVSTEINSVTDIHVITALGAYNFQGIKSIAFWNAQPDSALVETLRNNGIGVYLKTKFLKPHAMKSDEAWKAKVMGNATDNDTIWIKGGSFWLGGRKLGARGILTILEGTPAARDKAAKARSNYNAAQIIGFVGGALIGWPVGQALAGKQEPQWGLAAGGAVLLIGAGIPLSIGFKNHVRKAISSYNQKTSATGSSGLSFQFQPGINGGTLVVRF